MGACLSSEGPLVSEEDKRKHREVERELKEAKATLDKQIKVLLLGSGDSGKSTILKQMRLIHHVDFSAQEVEHYRQLVFGNLTHGMRYVLDAMDDFGLKLAPENEGYVDLIDAAPDVKDGEPFPAEYREPLRALWQDKNVRAAVLRGNEAALPENEAAVLTTTTFFFLLARFHSLTYFYEQLDVLFAPDYRPTEQDIVHTRARTIGITETKITFNDKELLVVDVGGQKSERRKWIHCFQDVTSILFLASLSGYDQCLVEDKDAHQMQDAMTIFDSICTSAWFKQTSIILFLNKQDLFEQKIQHSNIKDFFPDYEGAPGDARAGREYFRSRFVKLAAKAGRGKDREIYVHFTTATDTTLLRAVLAAVEE
ncbi:heterotrimeric G protein alpha subunit 4 [Punctularia strigosozonata HHB-11173 SS5]|uniref:heterotrimeric G protein alpha subunit 4 n=1 Tax=Punctularia strigosozonata (strain HHB-11173) TaxID=741275 RepID=UPI00044183FE|nr:heterotrimeric G protein alpha subunit 4 [Punctularia strigosozonata HHB-11173 SS5]EIN05403.1 heterotrimeric G protein alpha subunit 4 [Punctularia strigosozonata HHB-11173 SS5]